MYSPARPFRFFTRYYSSFQCYVVLNLKTSPLNESQLYKHAAVSHKTRRQLSFNRPDCCNLSEDIQQSYWLSL